MASALCMVLPFILCVALPVGANMGVYKTKTKDRRPKNEDPNFFA